MTVDITLPASASHLTSVRVNHWYYEEGDEVLSNTDLLEVFSEEGPLIVQSSSNGILEEVYYYPGDHIEFGEVLGQISQH